MTLIKKRDVKEYFASRRRQGNQIHIVSAVPANATALPGNESIPAGTKPLAFNQDFITEHSPTGAPALPANSKLHKVRQIPAVVKRAKE